jgi:hypothetical protein
MGVWLPDNAETLRASALVIDDNAKRFESVTASHTFDGDTTAALIDGLMPSSSSDTSIPRWTSWPEKGKPQSLDFNLAEPTLLRSVEVYWYDDRGGAQTPVRWGLEVQNEAGEWRRFPLYNTDAYGVAPDQFNIVHPAEPLTTHQIRLRVWPREDAAPGILEFVVRPESH